MLDWGRPRSGPHHFALQLFRERGVPDQRLTIYVEIPTLRSIRQGDRSEAEAGCLGVYRVGINESVNGIPAHRGRLDQQLIPRVPREAQLQVVSRATELCFQLRCEGRAIFHRGRLDTHLGRGGLSDDVCSQHQHRGQTEERLERGWISFHSG